MEGSLWLSIKDKFQNGFRSRHKERRELARRYRKVEGMWKASPLSQMEPTALAGEIVDAIFSELDRDPSGVLYWATWAAVEDFITDDGLLEFPSVDFSRELPVDDLVKLSEALRRKELFLSHADAFERWKQLIYNTFAGFLDYIPPLESEGEVLFAIPLVERSTNYGEMLDCLFRTVLNRKEEDARLFNPALKARLYQTLCWASGLDPEGNSTKGKFILPSEQKKPPPEVVTLYLSGTPYEAFFNSPVPFSIPLEARFEHTLLIASSGWGKTEALKTLMTKDLNHGFAVIDSQMDLINQIARLDHDRPVILIDPADTEYPIAFNLFDVDITQGSASDKEAIMNGVIATYEYIFGGLFGAEFTLRQRAMFGYIARLMLAIPQSTIFTLKDIFEQGEKYRPSMEQLQGIAKEYFEKQFFQKKLAPTKDQVLDRLYGLLENPTFARMFSQTENRLDLFRAMNEGALILISTAKSHLQGELFRIFGKFFIGMLTQAALKRQLLPAHQRTPFFCYIDEAAEYLNGDAAPVETLVNQARKYRVGLLLTLQNLQQMNDKLRATVLTSTSIKFVGGVNEQDERLMAKEMRVEPDFIKTLRKDASGAEWALWVRNRGATKVFIPFGSFQELPKKTDEEYDYFIHTNREKYCNKVTDNPLPLPREEATPLNEPTEDSEECRDTKTVDEKDEESFWE